MSGPIGSRPHPSSRQVGFPTLPELCRCDRPQRYLDPDDDMWRCHACGRCVSPVPNSTRQGERVWTRAGIVRAIRAHHHRTGYLPKQRMWTRRADDHPSVRDVEREFGPGGWKRAIRAAGFEPPPQGRKPKTTGR